MSEVLKTSIDEIMKNFETSISTLFPIFKQAQLVDIDLEGYDGWDRVTEALFKSLVEDSIRWSLEEKDMNDFLLPQYDFDMNSIKGKSYIQVITDSPRELGKIFCFISFSASEKFLKVPSLIIVKEVLEDEKLSEFKIISNDNIKYSCSFFNKGNRMNLDKLNINN